MNGHSTIYPMREATLIDVTQSDIAKGVRGNSYHCPISRAVRRATGKRIVYASPVSIIVGARRLEYWTPWKAALFMQLFDDQKPVKPFMFELYWGKS